MARVELIAVGALAAAIVLRRLLRSRRWFERPPTSVQCVCCAPPASRGPTTPSKRTRPVDASDEDSTPARPERLNSDPHAATKRTSHLTWDEYFMAVAFLSAQRSKDPNRQVGACVVNGDRKIVGIGYNGFPWGCSDDQLPWAKKGETALDTKYPYVCHAELNAIMNANSKTLRGCTIYVTLFPCNECAKLIIQARISRVLFYSDMYHDTISTHASKRMLELAGVEMHRFTQLCPSARQSVTLDFASMC